jgi:hypothetical protein
VTPDCAACRGFASTICYGCAQDFLQRLRRAEIQRFLAVERHVFVHEQFRQPQKIRVVPVRNAKSYAFIYVLHRLYYTAPAARVSSLTGRAICD